MRIAKSNRGLTTDVVIDSKGQSFDKNVQPQHMHEGDVGFHIFSCLSQQHGEMSPSQLATASRELDEMVSAHKQALGLPQTRSPYQPGMVIKHKDGYGVVEQIIGTALQIRDFNDRGKTFTSVINLVGTSEVEGRLGIEGLVLEVAENSLSRITQAVALLLESREAVRDLFLCEGVSSASKEVVLDRLDCTSGEFLTILRQDGLKNSLVAQIVERAKDDRVYIFAALRYATPELLDKVTDQSLLEHLATQNGGGLKQLLGDLSLRDNDLAFRALSLIQDQDKLYEIANTAYGSEVCEKAILKVKDDVKVREWVVKSHGATIQLAPAWTKRFSTWSSEALNLMVMDTELIHNEGIFEAAAKTGKLDPTSYRAIVEKFERLNPLSERVLPYLMGAEDREFIASKLLKWASSQDQRSKKVVQSLEISCVAAAIGADRAKVPLSPDLAEMLVEIALLPAMFVGQSVENQPAFRAANFGLVDPVVLQRVMKEAAMPEVRKLAKEKLAAILRGDTDTV
ncbi:MAG: hypothetical protein WC750_03665 [Patescibacteria group bacterium]|jgi:hypothetical protein